jgi:hypothetical protein
MFDNAQTPHDWVNIVHELIIGAETETAAMVPPGTLLEVERQNPVHPGH